MSLMSDIGGLLIAAWQQALPCTTLIALRVIFALQITFGDTVRYELALNYTTQLHTGNTTLILGADPAFIVGHAPQAHCVNSLFGGSLCT